MSAMVRRSGAIAAVVALASVGFVAPMASADDPTPPPPRAIVTSDLTVLSDDAGAVLAVAPVGTEVPAPSELDGASPQTVARAQVGRAVRGLGLDVDTDDLRLVPSRLPASADAPVRFAQWIDGLPVYASSVVASLSADGGLRSLGAATTSAATLPSARIAASSAQSKARTQIAQQEKRAVSGYVASRPYALAFAPELLGRSGTTTRAWRTLVTPTAGIGGFEVIIDAVNGNVLQTVERVQRAQRGICDGNNTYTGDSSYGWCGENSSYANVPYARAEGDPLTGISEADAAYDALGDVTTFFSGALGVDINALVAPTDKSIGRGTGSTRTLAGVVRYCDPVEAYFGEPTLAQIFCPLPNAYWYADESNWNPATQPYPGGQMFIGQGFAQAVDVVAHEVSHGVTSATSNLVYTDEPGAINESMSDIFGQIVQVYADSSADPAWLLGEDIAAPSHPPIDAFNGPVRGFPSPGVYGQPSSMTDPLWDLDPNDEDAGGVHANSGVGNYAAYLMSHGGTFKGVTVAPLDTVNGPNTQEALTKLARLYWTVQGLLPSNADYRVLGLTLGAACSQLVGTEGFTSDDCTGSVAKAVLATGMTRVTPTLSASAATVVAGRPVSLTGVVKNARGSAAPGVSVRLERMVSGSTSWLATGAATTSSTGKATWSIVPSKATSYRLVVTGGGVSAPSGAKRVSVAPVVSRTLSDSSLRLKQSFVVAGRVSPNRAWQLVRLERYSAGSWKLVRTTKLTSTSTYRFTVTPSTRSTTTFRVAKPAESAYAASASSTFKVTVR